MVGRVRWWTRVGVPFRGWDFISLSHNIFLRYKDVPLMFDAYFALEHVHYLFVLYYLSILFNFCLSRWNEVKDYERSKDVSFYSIISGFLGPNMS